MEEPLPDLDEYLRDERRHTRRTLWLVSALPVALALGLLAVTTWRVAEAEADVEMAQDSLAQVEDQLASTALLVQERRAEVDSLTALKDSLYAGLARIDRPLAAQTVEAAATEVQAERAEGRVYLQVLRGDRRQELQARRLSQALVRNGFEVPVLERVPAVPRQSDLRYYNRQDAAMAERIAGLLRREARLSLQVRDLSEGQGQRRAVAPGTFEIWLAE